MSTTGGLLAFGALGFLSSLHCVGMCGGFALAVALQGQAAARRLLADQLLFAAGKAATYAVLGLLVVALLRGALGASSLGALQQALCIAAGLVLVLGGCSLLGLLPRFDSTKRGARPLALFTRTLARAQSGARGLGGAAGAFAAGAVTGLLPCGLSWSAFALATQVPARAAVPGLFLFGFATAPALALFALGGRRAALLTPRTRALGVRFAGLVLIAFGLVTWTRGGWTSADALAGAPAPACCDETTSAAD